MPHPLAERAFLFLPYPLRRAAYRSLRPRRYAEWLRPPRGDRGALSLEPFRRLEAIFVHVPKCAGVSVCGALFGCLGGGHMKLWQYEVLLGRELFIRSFRFAFVRNPWDRVHSAFWFLKQGGLTEEDAAWSRRCLAPYDTFEEFVHSGLARPEIQRQVHFVPQVDFLTLGGGSPVCIDYLGYFERLPEDFEEVRRLKFPSVDARLEARNQSKAAKGDYRDAYSDSTRRLVADFYQRDIQLLGYDFQSSTLPELVERRSASLSHDRRGRPQG